MKCWIHKNRRVRFDRFPDGSCVCGYEWRDEDVCKHRWVRRIGSMYAKDCAWCGMFVDVVEL